MQKVYKGAISGIIKYGLESWIGGLEWSVGVLECSLKITLKLYYLSKLEQTVRIAPGAV